MTQTRAKPHQIHALHQEPDSQDQLITAGILEQ